jgi:large subunit ribosomal protein L9
MRIILQREVENLGAPGDIVEVKDGYARNFLIPRGLAVQASRGALRHSERMRVLHESRQVREREEADALATRIAKTPVRIAAQAGEEGRLFGSVTSQDIAEALARSLERDVDRRKINLAEPIRSTGTHVVQVHLHPEVNADLTVEVVGQ